MSSSAKGPWRFQFYFNEVKSITFRLVLRFKMYGPWAVANGFEDALAKLGVERVFDFSVYRELAFLFLW